MVTVIAMARPKRTSTTPVRVYSYGARAPITNLDLVNTELRSGRMFYNDLVAIEHSKFERREQLENSLPELNLVKQKVDELRSKLSDAVRAVKAAKSGGGKPTKEQLDLVKSLRADLPGPKAELSRQREIAKPIHESAKAEIHLSSVESMKAKRAERKLREATSDRAILSADAAVKAKWKAAVEEGIPYTPPGFRGEFLDLPSSYPL